MVCLVIFIHTSPGLHPCYQSYSLLETFHSGQIYSLIVDTWGRVTNIAVPFFFFVAGYYFIKEKELTFESWKNKIKKRISTLLIPYILWNVIAIIMDCINIIVKKYIGIESTCTISNISELINALWGINGGHFPYLTPLWFVRDLFIIGIFSPIIVFLCKKYPKIFISVLSCMFVFNSYLTFMYLGGWLCVYFFSLGIFTQLKEIDLIKKNRILDSILITFSVLCLFCSIYNHSLVSKASSNILILCLLLILFRYASRLVAKYGCNKLFERLSESSFFVYALHCITIFHLSFLQICLWSTRRILCADTYELGLVISYFITPFICYGVCYTVYWILKRKIPTIVNIVSGNR